MTTLPDPTLDAWAILANARIRRMLLIATLLGGMLIGAVTFSKAAGLFSGDEGVKLAQSFALIDNGPLAPQLPYPGKEVDPGYSHYPLGPPFVVKHDNQRYGIYSILFSAPSAVGYSIFGFWGLYLFPLLCGVWILWLTMRLVAVLTGSLNYALGSGAILLIATPITLNAALFNEHVPAVALFLAGTLTIANPSSGRFKDALAGLAFAASLSLRPELLAVAPLMPVFLVGCRGFNRATLKTALFVGAAALLAGAAIAFYNYSFTGSVLPSLDTNQDVVRPAAEKYRLLFDDWIRTRLFAGPGKLVFVIALLGVAARLGSALELSSLARTRCTT